ncbi:B3/B4 domain-containing protein [Alteribacillus iranensis]|uniref:B3/B4 domain-containing protein (DNA/RNA-binding domain of Phe-tRNA-synthetase) n=1 Tax=Alteribacillus iranensis TaxID=930128 RepID=A0A1I2FMH4_9BACI|nr:phenylalanine--tRNA ligase beta subunit-related protein [Alteribacillus iranensis]SFF05978.1 B3/B4 domain-containing protein (DNA/RNA-binding domain of Phe-tRNA-synthetase) [Alteribacillus iranensis]
MIISLSEQLTTAVPHFHVGLIVYKNIVIDESPQMLKGRLDFFQEKIKTDLLEQSIVDYPGVLEWKQTFKQAGIDATKNRPSHEALFRRISKGQPIPFIHSAVDLNNFFSLQYEIPIGLYDWDSLRDYIKLSIGTEEDTFQGINGRWNKMKGKFVSKDKQGAFGSPIVDSQRTKTTHHTKNALQIFYLRPSIKKEEALQLLRAASNMFFQIHSGEASIYYLNSSTPDLKI